MHIVCHVNSPTIPASPPYLPTYLPYFSIYSVALERATTAREAIAIMGQLAESLGFYAADWSGGDLSKGEGESRR
jgi:dipeptidase